MANFRLGLVLTSSLGRLKPFQTPLRSLQHLDFFFNYKITGDLRSLKGLKLLSCTWLPGAWGKHMHGQF